MPLCVFSSRALTALRSISLQCSTSIVGVHDGCRGGFLRRCVARSPFYASGHKTSMWSHRASAQVPHEARVLCHHHRRKGDCSRRLFMREPSPKYLATVLRLVRLVASVPVGSRGSPALREPSGSDIPRASGSSGLLDSGTWDDSLIEAKIRCGYHSRKKYYMQSFFHQELISNYGYSRGRGTERP